MSTHKSRAAARSDWPVRKLTRRQLREEDDYVPGTPAERLSMMERLRQNAIPFLNPKEQEIARSKLLRHLIRVVRR